MADQRRLFASRLHAAAFLLGLATFWCGFLALALMLLSHDPHLGRRAELRPAEAVAIVLLFAGGIALGGVQLFWMMRLDHGRATMMSSLRVILPSTIASAARTLGLNGPVVVAVLYTVLLAGVIAFFSGLLSR